MSDQAQFRASVVIPCLNEERTIENCVVAALNAFRDSRLSGEVLVVDNGSTDRSPEVAREAGARVISEPRKGYGHAVVRGLSEAHGEFLVFADGDESYDFGYVGRFVELLAGGADLVIGNRLRGRIDPGAMPILHRYLGTPVLSLLVRLFFRVPVHDINCGMRGIRGDAFRRLKLSCGGMESASEMIIKAGQAGLKITEIPMDFHRDKRDHPPHLKMFRDGWRHLRLILLFAPKWLFLLMGGVLGLAGSLLMLLIFLGAMDPLGVLAMFACLSLILLGSQFVLYAISTYGFTLFLGSSKETDQFFKVFRNFTIEKGIASGSILFCLGLLIATASGIVILAKPPEGEYLLRIAATKWMFLGMTLIILGFQAIISSFYLCPFNITRIED